MPSFALTAGATALVLAVASNAASHVDSQPIHLRKARSNNLRRRQNDPTSPASVSSDTSTNLFATANLPPAKQDSIYASESFLQTGVSKAKQLLQVNIQAANEAIKQHKNEPSSVSASTSLEKRAPPAPTWRWDFRGKTPVRGVNLGGWLVTEPWITPSLYTNTGNEAIVDEWTFCEKLGPTEARKRLSKHWDTFYTEADIAEIASYGLNHVRIPIGYWAFERKSGEPYINGQLPYLYKAIDWARKHGVKVMVDIHGAPGSQNGFDNSGRRGNVTWHLKQENINRTLNVVSNLSKEFAKPKYKDTVTILQALNEPAGFVSPDVITKYRQFAYDSYGRVRYPTGSNPSDVYLSLHDAFQPLSVWEKSFPSPQFQGVSYSDHPYFVFNENDLRKNDDQRIATICGMKDYYARAQSFNPILLDEFTAATTDCTNFLNGRGIGARYDGTYPGSTAIGSCQGKSGKASTFSEDYKTSLRKSWAAQIAVWEKATSGWISWTFKAENSDDWTYQAGVKNGWIPKNPSKPFYKNLCGSF